MITCSSAAQADLMMSGDAYGLNLKRYHGRHIVAAGEALASIERE